MEQDLWNNVFKTQINYFQTQIRENSSSSSSSAISSSTSDQFNAAVSAGLSAAQSPSSSNSTAQMSQDDLAVKNMIITNLVSYSYEIAHTVKRIVCAMGADN